MSCYIVLAALIAGIVGLLFGPLWGAGVAALALLLCIFELASQLNQGINQARGRPPADDYDPSLW
jgi:hypothetical protein